MYAAKLEELKALGAPIEERHAEEQARPVGAACALEPCGGEHALALRWTFATHKHARTLFQH